ncbi:MAG: hypothetical protein MUC87_13135 [Bacteroidia bacterium]|jgi:hypothetical protein|nr:hypothetical protein [Bacteroidia bacterium]
MDQTNATAPEKRPTLLTVLCILTWIGSGLGALAYLLIAIAAGTFGAMLSSIPGVGAMLGGGTVMFILLFLFAVGKIYGAAQMWKLKKMGFYIYTACELLAFGIGAYLSMKTVDSMSEGMSKMSDSLGVDIPAASQAAMETAKQGGGFPVMGLVFSLLFIVLYYLNVKKMK